MPTAKLKSAKFFPACMHVWRYRTIPPNLSPEWCEKRHLGPEPPKFNDRQYFRLYGISHHVLKLCINYVIMKLYFSNI